MIGRPRIAATRSALLAARAQLGRVRSGAFVLRRKRRALVTELFRLARPAVDQRAEITRQLEHAYTALLDALAEGHQSLTDLGVPERRIEVELTPTHLWGIAVADVERTAPVRRTLEARGTPPGSTSRAVVIASDRFESALELLIAAAPAEMRVARLADAVARTAQQLHVLEERVEPELVGAIAGTRRTLEEREREEHHRLKRLLERRRSMRN